MNLIDKLYEPIALQNAETRLKSCPFWFFSPEMKFFGFKSVYESITNKDKYYFIKNLRSAFFPGINDLEQIQELFNGAINRGVGSINFLLDTYLEEILSNKLKIEKISSKTNHHDLNKEGREKWIRARNGKHKGDFDNHLLRESYDIIRKIGLGYITSLIDSSPEISNSLRHIEIVREWFSDQFDFEQMGSGDSGLSDLGTPFIWNTKAGVEVYGNKKSPIRYRAKIIDRAGNLKYSSMLMKMFRKGEFMGNILDHIGVEFIVKDKGGRKKLVNHFRLGLNESSLEKFKHSGLKGKFKRDPQSNERFGATKFIIRPPVKVEPIGPYEKIGFQAERIPVEVQILTLDEHKIRLTNPDVTHKKYKQKQFYSVFPMWFPKKLYKDLIEQYILK